MLKLVTTLGRSGLQDWLIQRISAVILAVYSLTLLIYWLWQPAANFNVWQHLFNNIFIKYATLIALLSLIAHAWIGLWTVTTDYLKSTWIRLSLQFIIFILLLFYFVWGVQILWG
jgi:succinate dehydrogenase / fumarate reductase, membrane anchor subunit